MAKKHSIQIDLIDKFAIEFIEKEGYEYSIEIHTNKTIIEKHIQIYKEKTKGKIVFYISGGQVSYQVQTGNQTIRTILERCWQHIFENTKLPNIDAKSFSAKNIETELFDCFIEDLRKQYNIQDKDITNSAIRNQYLINGEYGACLSITYYKNGTLYIQGRITSLFVRIISEVVEELAPDPKYVKDIFLAIEPEKDILIDTDLSIHIKKLEHIIGSKIEAMIKTSIQLVNYAWPLDDYCCFTHSILRALEGLIRKRLMEDSVDTFDNIGEFFQDKDNTFKFKDDITRFDDIPALKNSLEEAYDFYNKNRHAISHVDKANIEASKMMNYDDAVDVINECLKRINRLCNNWNLK